MEIGFAPAKESCLPLPIPESKGVPVIMADARISGSWKAGFWPWDEGDEEALRVGVAMSIGEVIGMVALAGSSSR